MKRIPVDDLGYPERISVARPVSPVEPGWPCCRCWSRTMTYLFFQEGPWRFLHRQIPGPHGHCGGPDRPACHHVPRSPSPAHPGADLCEVTWMPATPLDTWNSHLGRAHPARHGLFALFASARHPRGNRFLIGNASATKAVMAWWEGQAHHRVRE